MNIYKLLLVAPIMLFIFSITSKAAADTLIFNGTFENELSGWRQVEPASPSSDSLNGEGAGKVEEGGQIFQTVTVDSDSEYTLTASIKIESDDDDVGDLAGSSGVIVDGETYLFDTPTEANDYQDFEITFSTGDATEVEVFFYGGDLRIDDVVLDGPFPDDYSDPYDAFDWSLFSIEGEQPVVGDSLVWEALEQCVITPNGNGCRHEAKIQSDFRYPASEQYERFSATVEAELSDGAETIFLQWHPEGLATLAALYLADIDEDALVNTETGLVWLDLENGIANDGVFDLIAITRAPGATELLESGSEPTQSYGGTYQETGMALGTIVSGESFDVVAINDHATFTITTTVGGVTTSVVLEADDSANSYMKFGNYLQTRDPYTHIKLLTNEEKEDMSTDELFDAFQAFYDAFDITEAITTFTDTEYERELDDD